MGEVAEFNARDYFDRLRDSLVGDGDARAAALAAADAAGMPTRHNEAWHYTDLPRLLKTPATQDETTDVDFGAVHPCVAMFDNGKLEVSPENANLRVEDFSGASVIGDSSMANYNAALAQNGLVAEVTGALAQPLLVTTRGDQDVYLAHKITLAKGAKATLIDNHMATGYSNVVFDITLEDGAALTLIRSQQAGRQVGLSRVQVHENARYKSVALVSGGALARHETHIALAATGAHGSLHSAVLGHGQTHTDFTHIIDHQVADTSSDTSAYNVLNDSARGVFQGKVIVRPDAQRVDAQMQTRAMMLSADAEMDAKPELEIYADDVVCAHGSAIGALDSDALFFLRARGLDEMTARHLLVSAFIEQVTAHIDDADVAEILRTLIKTKISRVLSIDEATS